MATAPAFGFNTPFAEQLAFFRQKLNLPTDRWDDIERRAHDRAFIVAGAARADLLDDLRAAVDHAVAKGTGLEAFRKDFKAIVARHGWTGWTGEGSAAGVAWRTKVIYQTNMTTSYAAGRYRQLTDPAFVALMPYWRYVHSDSVMHPRPLHKSWHGLTLAHDHPLWRSHFPPNGWGCQCEVTAVRRPAPGDATEPPKGWDAADPKTGAPVGIDKGFDYAPGANVTASLQSLIDQKLIKLDAPIGAQMWQHLKPAMALERQQQWWQTLDEWFASVPKGRTAIVGAIDPVHLDWLAREQATQPVSAAIEIREGLIRGTKQARHLADQDGLLQEDWRRIPTVLAEPEAVYFDTRSGKLLYVIASGDTAGIKLAVEFDYRVTKTERVNMIVSGFRQAAYKIAEMVKGGLLVRLPDK